MSLHPTVGYIRNRNRLYIATGNSKSTIQKVELRSILLVLKSIYILRRLICRRVQLTVNRSVHVRHCIRAQFVIRHVALERYCARLDAAFGCTKYVCPFPMKNSSTCPTAMTTSSVQNVFTYRIQIRNLTSRNV